MNRDGLQALTNQFISIGILQITILQIWCVQNMLVVISGRAWFVYTIVHPVKSVYIL